MEHGVNESIYIIDMIIRRTSERGRDFNITKVAFRKSGRIVSNILMRTEQLVEISGFEKISRK